MNKAIEISNLTKYYGKNKGIENLSLSVDYGDIFGFIGPNGAGKSTTIHILMGMIFSDSGKATINNFDCVKNSIQIKNSVGYMPAEPEFYDDMKVLDIISYNSNFYGKDSYIRGVELAKEFELDTKKRVDDLSLGNKKKLSIVIAFMNNPQILILDEPTSGLDPIMKKKFFDLINTENKKGCTIFFSSHNLFEVQKFCNKVGIIKDGTIIKVESMDEFNNKQFKMVKAFYRQAVPEIYLEGAANIIEGTNSIEFLYSGKFNTLMKELIKGSLIDLYLEEPSLEDVFLHYYESEGK